MLKPHHVGSPIKLWLHLIFSTIVSITTAIMIVHGIKNIIYIFVYEVSSGAGPFYILSLIVLVAAAVWQRRTVMELVSFAGEYVETVMLGIAAIFVGLFERNKNFNGKILYLSLRLTAFVYVVASAALACTSLFWTINEASAGWISSVLFALTGFVIYSLLPVVLDRPNNWKSFSERIKLRLFETTGKVAVGLASIEVVHLSDLHITRSNRTPLAENDQLRMPDSRLKKLIRLINAVPAAPIIVSGDATDTGDADEWERFKTKFAPFKERIVVGPGNHDLNIVGYGKKSLLTATDLLYYEGRINRLRAYLRVAIDMMGDRVRTLKIGAEGNSIALRSLKDALSEIEERAGLKHFQELNALFPLVVTVPGRPTGVYAVVWNTTRTSALAIFNSLGKVDAGQLGRLSGITERLKDESATPALIHVLHHKLAMPVEIDYHQGNLSSIEHLIQFASMTMQNASALLRKIESAGTDTVVLHGHHHVRFAAQVVTNHSPAISIVSAQSSTLACEGHVQGQRCMLAPGFDLVTLDIEKGNVTLAGSPSWQTSKTNKKPGSIKVQTAI